jgi:hypothetical protein
MSAVIVAYCPASGGNHLKNILSLSSVFANQREMDLTVYDRADQTSGAVHSVSGRNVQDIFIDRMIQHPEQCWLLSGHFGELAPVRQSLLAVDCKFLIVTIDQLVDRRLLERRQQRLGQHCHPYWLEEEQLYLYQPQMYQTYFGVDPASTATISLYDLWHPTLCDYTVITKINEFLNINIDRESAQNLQQKWWNSNFEFKFSDYEQGVYKVQKQ